MILRSSSWSGSLALLVGIASLLGASLPVNAQDAAPTSQPVPDPGTRPLSGQSAEVNQTSRGVQPFSATYRVAWHGIGAGSSTLTLSPNADGSFTYASDIEASGIFSLVFPDALVQSSTFALRDGRVAPLIYRESGMKRDHSQDAAMTFNWDTHQVSGTVDLKALDAPFPDGVLDPMSVQVELMRQLRLGQNPARFTLWDRHEAKDYNYTREGEATLDTPLGRIATVIYRSDRPGSDRVTRLWLAPSLGWLPIQAARSRKDSTDLSMKITSTTLQGSPPKH